MGEYRHGGHKFQTGDISLESYREYEYEDGYILRVEKPIRVFITERNSHRVQDGGGIVHYIPSGWRQLRWLPLDDSRPVQF